MSKATAFLAAVALVAVAPSALADLTAQPLPFSQDWTNTGMITTNNDWSGVPGIIGYRGDDLTTAVGTDPQTITADGSGTPVNVTANNTNPGGFLSGGNLEAEITNPVVAFQGSATADAPHIVVSVNTTGWVNIRVQYDLRDVDCSTDTTKQQVALHFRVGGSGSYANVPAAYVANAADVGASLCSKSTHVNVLLPASADNQPLVQVRMMTANAFSNDQFIGVDNILITGEQPTPVTPVTWGGIKALYR